MRIVPEAQIAQLQVDTFDLVYPNGAEGNRDGKCDVVGCVKGKHRWRGGGVATQARHHLTPTRWRIKTLGGREGYRL